MKIIRKLMRASTPEDSSGDDAALQTAPPVAHGLSSRDDNEKYSDELSFNWTPQDPLAGTSSACYDNADAHAALEDTQPRRTIGTVDHSSPDDGEDNGFDPYNTGRFKST